MGYILSVAGIVLFLYGMMNLGTGLQKIVTSRLRDWIGYAVRRPFSGLLTGIGTTVLFQSSSAATTITVGMVGAGLIGFQESLAIILGTDIGTTVTVQLIVWRVTDISPLFVIGGGTALLAGRNHVRQAGELVFYFGLIFLGLHLVGMASAPLKAHPDLIAWIRETHHPLAGFAFGVIFTALIHASAIPIGILTILAQEGLVELNNALPIVFGANVGTAATALMAAAVVGPAGKRTAVAHLLFKVGGAVVSLWALPVMVSILTALTGHVAQQIALGHFLFNLLLVVIFMPFLKVVARLLERLIPGEEEVVAIWPVYLKGEDLADGNRALADAHRELEREMDLAIRIYRDVAAFRVAYDEGRYRRVRYLEIAVNNIREEIIQYLRELSSRAPAPAQPRRLFAYTAMADEIERMANHMVSTLELLRTKHRRGIAFSSFAEEELEEIVRLVEANVRDAASLILQPDRVLMGDISVRENRIDQAVRQALARHLVRFHRRICRAEAGPVFVEMLIHLERISDHCQNIGEYMEELTEDKPLEERRWS